MHLCTFPDGETASTYTEPDTASPCAFITTSTIDPTEQGSVSPENETRPTSGDLVSGISLYAEASRTAGIGGGGGIFELL